jgi:hypothetical protein
LTTTRHRHIVRDEHGHPLAEIADDQVSATIPGAPVRLPDDRQAPGPVAQHVDRGAVERAQRRVVDHLLGRAGDGAAAGQLDDLVQVRQDRVDVVRDQKHRDVLSLAHVTDQRADRGWFVTSSESSGSSRIKRSPPRRRRADAHDARAGRRAGR